MARAIAVAPAGGHVPHVPHVAHAPRIAGRCPEAGRGIGHGTAQDPLRIPFISLEVRIIKKGETRLLECRRACLVDVKDCRVQAS